jgi:hypothetical protein
MQKMQMTALSAQRSPTGKRSRAKGRGYGDFRDKTGGGAELQVRHI